MTEEQIRETVRQLVAKTDDENVSKVARDLKVSPQYLHDFLNERRQPGKSILRALGLRKRVIYERVRA